MKKYLLVITLFIGFWVSSCFDDETIHAELGSYKRAYDTTSTDPVWKYVSQYYFKYGRLFITDSDSSDYLFNFQYKYNLWIKQPEQKTEHLINGIHFFEELFSNGYSDDFKKKNFPYNIILADSVVYTGGLSSTKWDPKNMYITQYYISFLVSERTLNMTETEKETLSAVWNLSFLTDFCVPYGGFSIPQSFYEVSASDYGKTYNEKFPIEECYAKGFIYFQWMEPGWFYDYWRTYFPQSDTDLKRFITWLFSAPNDEIMEIVNTYPAMKQKFDIIVKALKDIGLDYKNIGYKAKK